MTEAIRKLINKKGSLNIDGLFQFLKKDSIINKLFMKYPIQKVLDGFKNYVEYLDNEGNKEIGQDNLNDYFSYDQDGRIKSNFRGKDLNSNVLDKMKDTWTKTNKPAKKKEEIKQLDIEKNIVDFEEENKSWKQFLKDFKQGKTKFGGKIKLEDYEKNKIKLKKLLEKTEMLGRKLVKQDIRNESDFYKGLVKTFISERNKITRLYNKANSRFNNLSYLLDYGGDETEKKKEEEKKPEKDKLLNKLVATARSHAKNGISVDGLKDFFNKVQEYKKTNPPKLQSQLAGVLYNFLNKNIQMGKKKLPNNMNNALKELGYKEIKK